MSILEIAMCAAPLTPLPAFTCRSCSPKWRRRAPDSPGWSMPSLRSAEPRRGRAPGLRRISLRPTGILLSFVRCSDSMTRWRLETTSVFSTEKTCLPWGIEPFREVLRWRRQRWNLMPGNRHTQFWSRQSTAIDMWRHCQRGQATCLHPERWSEVFSPCIDAVTWCNMQ
jgi:hypothetical protein